MWGPGLLPGLYPFLKAVTLSKSLNLSEGSVCFNPRSLRRADVSGMPDTDSVENEGHSERGGNGCMEGLLRVTSGEYRGTMSDVTLDAEGQVPMVVSSLFWALSQPSIYLPDDHASNTCPGAIRKYRKTQRKEKLPESHHPEPGGVRPQCTFLPLPHTCRGAPWWTRFSIHGVKLHPGLRPSVVHTKIIVHISIKTPLELLLLAA